MLNTCNCVKFIVYFYMLCVSDEGNVLNLVTSDKISIVVTKFSNTDLYECERGGGFLSRVEGHCSASCECGTRW